MTPAPPPPPGGAATSARWRRVTDAAAPWAIVTLGLLLAWYSQISLRVAGPARFALAAVAGVAAVVALLRLPGSRWRSARILWAWLAVWAGIGVAAALAWRGLPVGDKPEWGQVRAIVTAREEVAQVAAAAAAASAVLAASAGRRTGARGFRLLWLAVLVTTAPVALREIALDEHIVVTRWIDWYFTPHTPAATFSNPNNYACVLVAVVGTLLAWSLDRVAGWARAALLAAATFATWLVWETLSRGAVAAIALQLLIAAVGVAARAGVGERLRGSRAARLTAGGLGVLAAAAAVAAFTVPALTAHNPLLRAPKAGEAASDATRLELIRAGWRYWQTSPLFGTGPGTFEYHLAREKPPGVPDPTINAHNAFVEILSQYGLLGALPLAALLLGLAWVALRPRVRRLPVDADLGAASPSTYGGGTGATAHADPAALISARVEIGCLWVAIAATGVIVSSALALPMWFLMLAHPTALAWSLRRRGA